MSSRLLALAVALCSISLSFAAPPLHTFVVKDSLAQIPHGWVKHSPAPPTYPIKLRIALSQPNFASLEERLYEISDPFHPKYGAHLSRAEIGALVAPHPESVELVDDWLQSHGIDSNAVEKSSSGDWVTILVPVSKAEEMMDCKYHAYKHPDSDGSIIRTQGYSLPKHLQEHIDLIQPTTMFGRPRPMASTIIQESAPTPPGEINCNTTITIDCLRKLYKTDKYEPLKDSGSRLGVASYLRVSPHYTYSPQTFLT